MKKDKKYKLFIKILSVVCVNIILLGAVSFIKSSQSVEALSKYGSRGSEVREIQTRLKKWGYYKGNVDGIFGSQTLDAVKYFQRKNGLAVDGIVGPKTLAALGMKTSSNTGYTSNDEYLLARMISAESRGEPYRGQVAVGAVILNRVEHPSFPDTISGVLYQPGAFSAIDDGQFNEPIADSARSAARDALAGVDPSGGAIYYYNPKKTSNKFMHSRPIIVTIGNHRFCS